MTYNELDRELFDEDEVPLVKADAFQGKIACPVAPPDSYLEQWTTPKFV